MRGAYHFNSFRRKYRDTIGLEAYMRAERQNSRGLANTLRAGLSALALLSAAPSATSAAVPDGAGEVMPQGKFEQVVEKIKKSLLNLYRTKNKEGLEKAISAAQDIKNRAEKRRSSITSTLERTKKVRSELGKITSAMGENAEARKQIQEMDLVIPAGDREVRALEKEMGVYDDLMSMAKELLRKLQDEQ